MQESLCQVKTFCINLMVSQNFLSDSALQCKEGLTQ